MLSVKYGKISDLKDLQNFDKNLRTNIKIYRKIYNNIMKNYKNKKIKAPGLDLRQSIKEVI